MKSEFKKFLADVAVEAGAIHLKYFNKVHRIGRKFRAGIVTEADTESEALILKRIRRKYPQSAVITEESGSFKGDNLLWIIDPLDGTTNYAHGFPWFAVSIGVWRDGNPVAGIIYNPVYREQFFAEKGKGAYFNGKRMVVSKTDRIRDALFGTGFFYSQGRRMGVELEIFRELNEVALGVRRPGAAALDMAYLASGRYDGFWERGLSPWDVAAGWLLVEEAGGKVSDYEGGPAKLDGREIVASNGRLHKSLVYHIQKADR